MAAMGLLSKITAPAVIEKDAAADNRIKDIPWLTRERLSYKDPERQAPADGVTDVTFVEKVAA
jgi:hypothetical protein